MMLQQASITDYESILSFYNDVMDHTPGIERYARWQKGKHPTAEGIKAYIQEGSLYLYKEQDAIIGAMALPMYQCGKQHLYEDKNGWLDFYYFEYKDFYITEY